MNLMFVPMALGIGVVIGYFLGKRKPTDAETVKGLLTANYIALKRINTRLEVFQDAEWQQYAVGRTPKWEDGK